ncbi:hypothetical protein [Dictyobacter arantiisoli]|uniref:Uncharacterized protein n=1 Tax=Dictyobacter arantiisoli TaxID=2014874 RepID=A0A5A5T5T0_9CHLR|nr:hypothetical protein [Dictyobacter arantiisoli]GCF06791.1 hypothetical protein KDI_03550 [Dictyobacter arantiisoli]
MSSSKIEVSEMIRGSDTNLSRASVDDRSSIVELVSIDGSEKEADREKDKVTNDKDSMRPNDTARNATDLQRTVFQWLDTVKDGSDEFVADLKEPTPIATSSRWPSFKNIFEAPLNFNEDQTHVNKSVVPASNESVEVRLK